MYQQDQQVKPRGLPEIADVAPRASSHDIALGLTAAGAVQVTMAPVARTVGRRSARTLSDMLTTVQAGDVERLRRKLAEADGSLLRRLARFAMGRSER